MVINAKVVARVASHAAHSNFVSNVSRTLHHSMTARVDARMAFSTIFRQISVLLATKTVQVVMKLANV